MQYRMKNAVGATVVLSGLPAWTQVVAQTSTATSAASAPEPAPPDLKIGDPVWFIAGFVVGAAAGVIGARVFGSGKSTK